jgi:hypothetical protein
LIDIATGEVNFPGRGTTADAPIRIAIGMRGHSGRRSHDLDRESGSEVVPSADD